MSTKLPPPKTKKMISLIFNPQKNSNLTSTEYLSIVEDNALILKNFLQSKKKISKILCWLPNFDRKTFPPVIGNCHEFSHLKNDSLVQYYMMKESITISIYLPCKWPKLTNLDPDEIMIQRFIYLSYVLFSERHKRMN